MKRLAILALAGLLGACAGTSGTGAPDDGSRLWLRQPAAEQGTVSLPDDPSATVRIAAEELHRSWTSAPVALLLDPECGCGPEGFSIRSDREQVQLRAAADVGLLYGAYRLLQLQACGADCSALAIDEQPHFARRILNHWDNLDRTVERGYAGRSLWAWEELPGGDPARYVQYARANASAGINGTVLNNVNASPEILAPAYLQKVQRLAELFRPYGIRVYLSVNFASPIALGGLATADPADPAVQRWWQEKAAEIYGLIPDFGGFLVKANSEGQPGPCDYGRSHAEGANLLADALQPYGGIVMWRAFVYAPNDDDRAKQAYTEFRPLDGAFRDNVIIQIKNGPVDFQPREPYSPLFGAMPQTQTMVEFQLTQEYLGHANHIVYLAPMWEEFFRFVAPASLAAVAGVANIGDSSDWCGNSFAQANWYAFGRMAWDPSLTPAQIADEWLCQTFTTDPAFVEPARALMLGSREAAVDYMMPLGLHHIFATGHHYGPEPWGEIPGGRPDWQPVYYHRADAGGIGFDRSASGSNAAAQYPEPLATQYGTLELCPERYLLWFHRVPWTHRMQNGETLWEALCHAYERGVHAAEAMQRQWDALEPWVDAARFADIRHRLAIQAADARWWKEACLLYFQEFAQMPFPDDVAPATHTLDEMRRFRIRITNCECAPQGFIAPEPNR